MRFKAGDKMIAKIKCKEDDFTFSAYLDKGPKLWPEADCRASYPTVWGPTFMDCNSNHYYAPHERHILSEVSYRTMAQMGLFNKNYEFYRTFNYV